jgi:hypothetical protein
MLSFKSKKTIDLYIIQFVTGLILFSIEIVIPKALLFLHIFDNILRILPVTFLGIAIGGAFSLMKQGGKEVLMAFGLTGIFLLLGGASLSITVNPIVISCLIILPFITCGYILATGLSLLNRFYAYAVDLTGCALGLLIAVFLLPVIGGEILWLILILIIPATLFPVVTARYSKIGVGIYFAFSILLLVVQIRTDAFNLVTFIKKYDVFDNKISRPDFLLAHKQVRNGKSKLLDTKWSSIARIDVVESDEYLFDKFFDGVKPVEGSFLQKSLQKNIGKPSVNLYYDNAFFSVVSKNHYLVEKHFLTIHKNPDVLIIGVGGGDDITRALNSNASSITAVEINKETIDLMKSKYLGISDSVYNKANIVHMDGRSFVKYIGGKYDVINIFFADLYVPFPNSNVFLESYLYTLEAFEEYFDHLKPDGIVHIGKWFGQASDYVEMLRMTATAAEALRRKGLDPSERIVFIRIDFGDVIYGDDAGYILIKKDPFRPDEIHKISAIVGDASNPYRIVYSPRVQGVDSQIATDWGEETLVKLLDEETPFKVYNDFYANISPTTDNKPFFYSFDKEYKLNKTILKRLIFLSLFILLPLFVFANYINLKNKGKLGNVKKKVFTNSSFIIYILISAFLGCAYAFMETSLIQRFNIYLGVPTWTLATVLLSLLVGGAIGSLLGQKLSQIQVSILLACAVLYTVFLHTGMPGLLEVWHVPSSFFRCLIVFMSILPLSVIISIPFPRTIELIESLLPGTSGLAYGINSLIMVITVSSSLLLALHYGFTFVGFLAAGMYFAVFLLTVFGGRCLSLNLKHSS